MAAGQAPSADQQRKTTVAFHKPHVRDTRRRQLKRRRLGVTAQEKPGDSGTADVTGVAAICTPLQLHSIALHWSCDQSITCSNQDAPIRIKRYVGNVDTCVTYVGQWRLFHQKLNAARFGQSCYSLHNHINSTITHAISWPFFQVHLGEQVLSQSRDLLEQPLDF